MSFLVGFGRRIQRAIPGLPGSFSSTRDIHLFPLKGHLCLERSFLSSPNRQGGLSFFVDPHLLTHSPTPFLGVEPCAATAKLRPA